MWNLQKKKWNKRHVGYNIHVTAGPSGHAIRDTFFPNFDKKDIRWFLLQCTGIKNFLKFCKTWLKQRIIVTSLLRLATTLLKKNIFSAWINQIIELQKSRTFIDSILTNKDGVVDSSWHIFLKINETTNMHKRLNSYYNWEIAYFRNSQVLGMPPLTCVLYRQAFKITFKRTRRQVITQ